MYVADLSGVEFPFSKRPTYHVNHGTVSEIWAATVINEPIFNTTCTALYGNLITENPVLELPNNIIFHGPSTTIILLMDNAIISIFDFVSGILLVLF